MCVYVCVYDNSYIRDYIPGYVHNEYSRHDGMH